MAFPQPIAEDDVSVTFQTPGGQPLRLPRDLANSIGYQPGAPAPLPSPQGGPPPAPGFQSAPPPAPQPEPMAAPEGPAVTAVDQAPADPDIVQPVFPEPQPLPALVPVNPNPEQGVKRAQQGQATVQQGFAAREAAANYTATAEANAAAEAAALLKARRQTLERKDAREDRIAAREQAEMDRDRKELGEATKAVFEMKVDRGKLIGEMSQGRKVGLAISLALGGLGSALKHQGDKNPALDILNKAIDDSVADQMAAIDKARGDVTMRRQLFGDKADSFKNRAAQAAMLRGRYIGAVQLELEERVAMAKSDIAKANGADVIGQLEIQKGQSVEGAVERELDNRRADRQVDISAYSARTQRMGLDAEAQARKDKAEADRLAKLTQEQRDRVVVSPVTQKPIGMAEAGRPEDISKLREKMADHAALRKVATEYQRMAKKMGSVYKGLGSDRWKPEDKARAHAMQRRVVRAHLKIQTGAAATDAEVEDTISQIPELAGWTDVNNTVAVVNDFVRFGDEGVKTHMRAANIRPLEAPADGKQYDPVEAYFTDADTAHRPKAGDPGVEPSDLAIDALSAAKSTEEAAAALKTVGTLAVGRNYGAFLGEDVKADVTQKADQVLADPQATKAQKDAAKGAKAAITAAHAREQKDSTYDEDRDVGRWLSTEERLNLTPGQRRRLAAERKARL